MAKKQIKFMVCRMVIVITAIGEKGRKEDGGSKCAIFKRIVRDSLIEKIEM